MCWNLFARISFRKRKGTFSPSHIQLIRLVRNGLFKIRLHNISG